MEMSYVCPDVLFITVIWYWGMHTRDCVNLISVVLFTTIIPTLHEAHTGIHWFSFDALHFHPPLHVRKLVRKG